MAQVLNLRPTPLVRPLRNDSNPRWTILQQKFGSSGRFSCLFADNRKQEQAKKALESALGGKKIEFEKWNKEIQKREEAGGGGNAGGGGWFGGGRWFGGSNGDHFWQEAQQASLAVLGIILVYLLIAKGNIMLAVFFNSLLFVLRGTRNGFTYISSRITEYNQEQPAPSIHIYLRLPASNSIPDYGSPSPLAHLFFWVARPNSSHLSKSMESTVASRRSGGGLLEGLYRVFMRRTSVYATFVVAGAFVGERVVDYGVHKLWEYNNVGKRFEDISVLGSRPSEE